MAKAKTNTGALVTGVLFVFFIISQIAGCESEEDKQPTRSVTPIPPQSVSSSPSLLERDRATREAEKDKAATEKQLERAEWVREFMNTLGEVGLSMELIKGAKWSRAGEIEIEVTDKWFSYSEEERLKIVGKCFTHWESIDGDPGIGGRVLLNWNGERVAETNGGWPQLR